MRISIAVVAASAAALAAAEAAAEPRFLRSDEPLGDPRGYCLDVPGFGESLMLDGPVQTHSCKYDRPGFYEDELIERDAEGRLHWTSYDRCLAAAALEPGAAVESVACDADAAHAWRLHDDARLTPAGRPDLCVTLASEREYAGTDVMTVPAYSSRGVTLEACATAASHRQAWRWSDPHAQTTYHADTLRDDIPPDVAERLYELGTSIDPAAVAELYAPLARDYGPADVDVDGPVSYGPDARHRLQVYTGRHRDAPGPVPVIVLVHGGGFTGGNLDALRHAATHFAGLGFVAVNITYPLAPEHEWPAGAEAVARAVEWVEANIAEYGGAPDRVVLLGHSAGGTHVADYVFRPSVASDGGPRVAGAIIASAPLDADRGAFGAYYGEGSGSAADKAVLGNIEDASVPVFIAVAERDTPLAHRSAAALYDGLVNTHGATPRIRQIPGHKHISYITAIGTGDRLFLEEALDFVSIATGTGGG